MTHVKPMVMVLAALFGLNAACGATDSGSEGRTSEALTTAQASVDGANIPTLLELVDTAGNRWTVASGVVYENAKTAGYSANVIALLFYGGVIYQENMAKLWWSWNGTTWVYVGADPRKVSAGDTSTPAASVLVDGGHDVWTVVSGVVYRNGAKAGYSAQVIELLYLGGVIYQENSAKGWWKWSGGAWVAVSDPVSSPPPPAPPPTTPPPAPSPPATGTSWVYHSGHFFWAGDWDGPTGPMNYAYAASGVDGSGPVMQLEAPQPNPYWLPYPPNDRSGPASNGVNFYIAPYSKFTIAIKPSKAGAECTMQFFKASGTTDDIVFGNSVNISQAAYGPSPMVANEWNVYTVPLADFALGGQQYIYKFIIDQQGTSPQDWELDQVGFEP
jgi:hypothetical protein